MTLLITPRQLEVLDFLKAYIAEKGRPPSYEEIRARFNLASKGNVTRLIECLERRGYVRRNIGFRRALEVIDAEKGEAVLLTKVVASMLKKYAEAENLTVNAAANALLRDALEAA